MAGLLGGATVGAASKSADSALGVGILRLLLAPVGVATGVAVMSSTVATVWRNLRGLGNSRINWLGRLMRLNHSHWARLPTFSTNSSHVICSIIDKPININNMLMMTPLERPTPYSKRGTMVCPQKPPAPKGKRSCKYTEANQVSSKPLPAIMMMVPKAPMPRRWLVSIFLAISKGLKARNSKMAASITTHQIDKPHK